jgi:Domain of unknown function (DUF6249)
MSSLGPYLVGVAFWIFVGVVAVAGIFADYKRRRVNLDVIRMAIDKGQQLDPVLIEKLTSNEQRDERMDPVQMKFAAIVTIASGIGVCLLGWLLVGVSPLAFYPTFGVGLLTICVGIGLHMGSKMLAEARQREQPRNELPRNELP